MWESFSGSVAQGRKTASNHEKKKNEKPGKSVAMIRVRRKYDGQKNWKEKKYLVSAVVHAMQIKLTAGDRSFVRKKIQEMLQKNTHWDVKKRCDPIWDLFTLRLRKPQLVNSIVLSQLVVPHSFPEKIGPLVKLINLVTSPKDLI